MKCSFCGSDNNSENKYCYSCGKPLVLNSNNLIDKDEIQENFKDTVVLSDFNQNSNMNSFDENLRINNYDNKENNSSNDTRKGNKLLIVILLIFIVFIGIAILVVFLLNPSPKRIFTGFSKKLSETFEDTQNKKYDSIYSDMKLNLEVSGTKNKDLESLINNFDISLSGGLDYKSKELAYNFKIDYKNKDFINLDMQYNKDLYLILNNLYDKPILAEESNVSDLFEKTDNKDLVIIINSYVKAFNRSLKNDYLTSKDEIIKVNGRDTKVKVSILDLNSSNFKEMQKDFINYISKDEEFLKAFARINDQTVEKVKEELKYSLENEINNDVKIYLYTTKFTNNFVKIILDIDGTKIDISKGSKVNNFVLKLSNSEVSILFDIVINYKYNEKIKLKDVSNSVKSDAISEEYLNILGNLTNQEGYKEFDKDLKLITGGNGLFSLLPGMGSTTNDNFYSY